MTDGYPFWLVAAVGAIAFLLGRWSAAGAGRGDHQQQARVQQASTLAMPQRPGGAGVDVDEFGLDAGLRSELIELMREDRKIEAIRLVRLRSGWGLKEAKDFVEHFAARLDQESRR